MSSSIKEIILRRPGREVFCFFWNRGTDTSSQIRLRLIKEGTELDLRGAFFVHGRDELSIRIEIIHEAPNTKSNTVLRGLVDDRAFADIHALAVLKKEARGAQTHVEAKAILWSPEARARVEPYLEIDEDDVRVTHAASVRPLDEEEIFYLMSRGLERPAAERLLIDSFFAPVKAAVPRKTFLPRIHNHSYARISPPHT